MVHEGASFMTHVWHVLSNMGTYGRQQQKYVTFLLKYKGISRSGIKLLGGMGIASKLTEFDKWVAAKIAQAKTTSRLFHFLK